MIIISRGRRTYPDGSYYAGDYLATHHGSKRSKEQREALFPLLNGKCHGKGTRVWSDGSKFVGDWADGKRCVYLLFIFYKMTEYSANIMLELIKVIYLSMD
jgi:hypothetical protein